MNCQQQLYAKVECRYIIIVSQSPFVYLSVSREKMTSPIANSHDPDFVYAAHQASHLSPQRPSHSNSEVASIENYGDNRTQDGSEGLFRGLNSYRVSGTRNHEFKTYLLDGKLVALPSVPLSNYSNIIDIKQD